MIYRQWKDLSMSQLGMGAMRLPGTGHGDSIDEEKAKRIIEYAYEHGVNYFDTAFRYHGGESEPFVGKVLKQYPRDTWYIATKMPGHMMEYRNGKLGFVGYMAGSTFASIAEIFEDQLERCGVDYFDFYLIHNLCETSYDFYTDEELGVVEYLLEQKKAGRIRHLGFSAHGRADTIERFLNWKNCFEFVQIQLNYLDWTLQDAKSKYEVITKHGLPVFVMEPVRGGRLASLGAGPDAALKAARPHESVVSWAFRFLQALPNVQMILSGMSTLDQIIENVEICSESRPLREEEQALLQTAASSILQQVPCTACRYCCEGCPEQLEIPRLISLYNELSLEQTPGLIFSIKSLNGGKLPSDCIACGNCTKLCPQGIGIPDVLRKMAAAISNSLTASL